MDSYAVVFPGQGSQEPGMALPWMDHPAAQRWAEASEALGRDVTRLGTHADAEELRDPWACQVALYVHHAVLLEAWRETAPGPPVVVAGHSLGEYSALLAAGVLSFGDGLRLIETRARLTSRACATAPGGMVACLGGDVRAISLAARDAGAHLANDNAPGQVVVAGAPRALAAFGQALADTRIRVVPLRVGAAYHSPLMEPAVEPFREALAATTFRDARVPVVANVDAAAHTAAGDWPDLLARQLTAPVRWRESVAALEAAGATEVVELGASSVLAAMVKRSARNLTRRAVTAPNDLAVGVSP